MSQKEENKSFKNSLWLTFLMPGAFVIPMLYMSSLGMIAGFLTDASWWVYPTMIFTAVDAAFLGAGIVGGYLPGKEEEETQTSKAGQSMLPDVKFVCGICYNQYNQDMFGAETIKEGKICRPCLAEKQRKEK